MKWEITQLQLITNVNKILIFFLLAFITIAAIAQGSNEKIEYSKNRKINLGALSIDGEVVVPDDLSVDVDEKDYTLDLYKRKNFNEQINNDFNILY